jgi:hypothetical protein
MLHGAHLGRRARTSAAGALASAPAAVLVLLMLEAVHEFPWGTVPVAAIVAVAGFLGPRFVLAKAGRLRPEHSALGLAISFTIVLAGAGIMLLAVWWQPERAWWVAGAAVALVAPAVVFSILDGATGEVWLQRVALGVLALVPGYAAAIGVSVGWLEVTSGRALPATPEVLLIAGPGMAVGHGVVFFAATLASGAALSSADHD